MDQREARNQAPSSVEEVLITRELARRPLRNPDYEAQSKAMADLGEKLAANPPGILQSVSNLARKLCRADSAGINILEGDGEASKFRWQAISGPFAPNSFRTIPRDSSPCGVVIARDEVLLFDRPDRYFAELREAEPRVYEALLAPWHMRGAPRGTLWVLGHTPELHFDSEDARIVEALARFAASSYEMVLNVEAARASESDMERHVKDEAHLLSGAFHDLREEMEMRAFAQDARDIAEEALRESDRQAENARFSAGIAKRIQGALENISRMLYDAEGAASWTDASRILARAQQELSRIQGIGKARSKKQRQPGPASEP